MIDLNALITPHFRWREFTQTPHLTQRHILAIRCLCYYVLEPLRRELGGRPLVVTSGYRTPAHNEAVGGAAHSQHLYAEAADIIVEGDKIEAAMKALHVGAFKVGIYPDHLHVSIPSGDLENHPDRVVWREDEEEAADRRDA